jgi:hypothetical protein
VVYVMRYALLMAAAHCLLGKRHPGTVAARHVASLAVTMAGCLPLQSADSVTNTIC